MTPVQILTAIIQLATLILIGYTLWRTRQTTKLLKREQARVERQQKAYQETQDFFATKSNEGFVLLDYDPPIPAPESENKN